MASVPGASSNNGTNDENTNNAAVGVGSVGVGVHTSNFVYVQSTVHGWVPARVLHSDGKVATVSTAVATLANSSNTSSSNENHTNTNSAVEQAMGIESTTTTATARRAQNNHSSSSAQPPTLQTVSLSDYPAGALPLQNVDAHGRLRPVADMVDLPFLHEVRIMCTIY